jgi:N,N-dimethylformamidase beta subunit-like protein
VPLAYETDNDLARPPGLLNGARAVISLGHDEYYSASMRAALIAARDAGTNLAFLGANAMFRHIRLAASPAGPDRIVICYKAAALDPLHGKRGAATTQDWRDPPDLRPESVITGVGTVVDRATQNLLRAFAAGPAGTAHPAHDNLAAVRPARVPAY